MSGASVVSSVAPDGVGSTGLSQSEVDARVEAVVSGNQQWWLVPEERLKGLSAGSPTRSYQALATNHETLVFEAAPSGFSVCSTKIVMPERWDSGSFRARFVWAPSNTNTGEVQWAFAGSYAGHDESFPSGATTLGGTLSTGTGTANKILFSNWIGPFTVTGAQPGDLIDFRPFRNGDNVNDTFTGTAYIIGVQLEWTSNAASDD